MDRRRWMGTGLVVLACLGAVIALRGRLPDAAETVAVLGAADPGWAALALAAALGSQLAFAGQQRRLLAGFGVPVPPGRVSDDPEPLGDEHDAAGRIGDLRGVSVPSLPPARRGHLDGGHLDGGHLGSAVVNWALDMLCLVAAAIACQVTIDWWIGW